MACGSTEWKQPTFCPTFHILNRCIQWLAAFAEFTHELISEQYAEKICWLIGTEFWPNYTQEIGTQTNSNVPKKTFGKAKLNERKKLNLKNNA